MSEIRSLPSVSGAGRGLRPYSKGTTIVLTFDTSTKVPDKKLNAEC